MITERYSKVAFISDTQFDQQLNYATLTDDGVSSRLVDSVECFEWVVNEAVKRGCEHLFHLGDVFDSRTTLDLSVLDAVCRSFFWAHQHIGLTLIPGNHDSYLRSSKINSLQAFRGVAHVIEEPFVRDEFAMVPWIEDDDVFAAEVQKLSRDKDARFLLAHCMVEGAVPGVAKARALSTLMPSRWKQVILGDVHNPVVLANNVRYCGSPMQWHYGDAGGKRGFLTLETKTGKVEFVENTHSPRFHLLDEVPSEAINVRTSDYVRIRNEDPGVSREIAEAIDVVPRRVETQAVEVAETHVRLGVSVHDDRRAVLQRFVEHQQLAGVDGLVDLGVEIVEAALHD